MRCAALVGLTVVLFAGPAPAQQSPYRATVTDSEVKVRAVPSDRFDDTGTLTRGTAVIVEREEANGWLAITAPYGSVSWIATQFIEDPAPDKPTPKNVLVHTEDEIEVTLAAGKAGLPQPFEIRRVKIPNGTGLLLIGPKVTFAGKTWYPIAPPAGDVRYVPKTALQFEKVTTNNFSVQVNENPAVVPAAGPPAGSIPATSIPTGSIPPTLGAPTAVGSSPPGAGPVATVPGPNNFPPPSTAASKPVVNHPLWAQAETAERENRLADAEKAYFELAAQMNGPGGDHDVANLCYTRIHAIRERKRASNTTGQAPKDDRGVRPGAPQAIATTTNSNGTNVNTTAGTKTDGAAVGDTPDWIGPGTLTVSALTLDGIDRKTYRLETAPGVVKLYVLAGPGVDLQRFVGKRVSVFGTPQSRSGLSKQVVIATNVNPE